MGVSAEGYRDRTTPQCESGGGTGETALVQHQHSTERERKRERREENVFQVLGVSSEISPGPEYDDLLSPLPRSQPPPTVRLQREHQGHRHRLEGGLQVHDI